MPTISELSKQPGLINEAIEKRQDAFGRALSEEEREIYFSLLSGIVEKLTFDKDGKVKRTAKNLLLISQVDKVFDEWAENRGRGLIKEFTEDLLAVAGMTALMYEGEADEAELEAITADNLLILAALGASAAGEILKGGYLWEMWRANQVRQELKSVFLSAIQSRQTLKNLQKTVREFAVGTGNGGKLLEFWQVFGLDTFNRVQEMKNEQFRERLDLHWFIYVGDVIKNTRDFCRPKAGGVFADVEADTEWPKDPDLPGKTSGIPYTPRIDRGRWNCRHRIRYITRELAIQLDPNKVEAIEKKYN